MVTIEELARSFIDEMHADGMNGVTSETVFTAPEWAMSRAFYMRLAHQAYEAQPIQKDET